MLPYLQVRYIIIVMHLRIKARLVGWPILFFISFPLCIREEPSMTGQLSTTTSSPIYFLIRNLVSSHLNFQRVQEVAAAISLFRSPSCRRPEGYVGNIGSRYDTIRYEYLRLPYGALTLTGRSLQLRDHR